VLTLSLLYHAAHHRRLGGRSGIPASSWLLAFSAFIFLSLALVKRCAELVSLEQSGQKEAPGRDYRVGDLGGALAAGRRRALSAVVVFGLFIKRRRDARALRHARAAVAGGARPGLLAWRACGSRPRAAGWTTILSSTRSRIQAA